MTAWVTGPGTCGEGDAVELAQDAEVSQGLAVVPGGFAQGAIHVHVGQVHHAGCHDLVRVRL